MLTPMLLLAALGCAGGGEDTTSAAPSDSGPDADSASASDSGDVAPDSGAQAPPSIFMITADTIARDFLGPFSDAGHTPEMEAFFKEAALFSEAVVPRGLTPVSMGTFLSGLYPRMHGIRDAQDLGQGWPGAGPLLAERLREAGYETHAFLANGGNYGNYGFDSVTHGEMAPGETIADSDARLVEAFSEALEASSGDRPVFAWIHLLQPHDPYQAVEPDFSELVDPDYRGELYSPSGEIETDALRDFALGEIAVDADDRAYLHAIYASEVRALDARFGQLFDLLEARGEMERGIVVVGFDHGEELMKRSGYALHGCSTAQEVLRVPWAIRAPGAVPRQIDAGISTADIPPTLIEMAGLEWSGLSDGISLAATVSGGDEPARDVFFEREDTTAGIIRDGWKYTLSPEGGFNNCSPYDASEDSQYAHPPESLFDLSVDPDEREDRAAVDVERRDEMRAALCGWLAVGSWAIDGSSENPVLQACEAP